MIEIVKYSDVFSEKDGGVELRNGESATILLVGEFFSVTDPSQKSINPIASRLGRHTDCRAHLKSQRALPTSTGFG